MTLVEVDAVDDALDRGVQGRVLENDVGRLAAELQGQALARPGQRSLDELAHLGRARERDLAHGRVRHDQRARLAGAREDVHHTVGQLSLHTDVGKEQRRQRRGLRGLQHDRVAGGQRRRDLPRQHQQREVPRDNLARDPDRSRLDVRERPLELVRPARVVEEVGGAQRDVDVAGLLDRLAAVHRLHHGELARALLQDARDPEEVARTARRTDARPRVERL